MPGHILYFAYVVASEQELDQTLLLQINELQALQADDQQHILKTLGALIREAKTRMAFG